MSEAPDRDPDLRLEMYSQARLLAAARTMVGALAQRLGFSESQCGQIGLAVDEALCNVINHGYERKPDGRIWLSVWAVSSDPPTLRVTIEDLAKQVDPGLIRSRDLEDVRPGGLGVYIIRAVMDEVTYEHRPEGGMKLTLVKQQKDDEEENDAGGTSETTKRSESA